MAEVTFPVLAGVTNARATADGGVVILTLQFGDGSTQDVAVHSIQFPHLLNTLRGFAGLADAVRRKMPADTQQEELIAPYRVTSVSTAHASDGSVVLKAGTADGMPVLLAFKADHARDAAVKLVASAKSAAESQSKKVN